MSRASRGRKNGTGQDRDIGARGSVERFGEKYQDHRGGEQNQEGAGGTPTFFDANTSEENRRPAATLSFSGPNPRRRWTGSSQPLQGDTAGHQERGSGASMQMPLQETADQQASFDGATLSPTAGPLQHEIAGQMKLEQQLIAKWMHQTNCKQPQVARDFLDRVDWNLTKAVQAFCDDRMPSWIKYWMQSTQFDNKAMAYNSIVWQKYDVEQAITVWKANGTASGVAHFTENPQPGVQKYGPQSAAMFNLDHPVTPVQRQYHDQTSPLAASPRAWSSPVGQMSAQTGGQLTSHKLGAQQGTKALRKLSEGRHKFARLSREDQAHMTRTAPTIFKVDSSQHGAFAKAPHQNVSSEVRLLLEKLATEIVSYGGCSPDNEGLVLLWMARQFMSDAAEQFRIALLSAEDEPIGTRIEHIMQVLAAAYADPNAAQTARDAKKSFKWPESASVAVIRTVFMQLRAAWAGAVEDSSNKTHLERLDPWSIKDQMIFLQERWPMWITKLENDYPHEFGDPAAMFVFVIRKELTSKPTAKGALHSITEVDYFEQLLQENPDDIDAAMQHGGTGALFAMILAKIKCWRCGGTHCKYQCSAQPSKEEAAGERDRTLWGHVPMCFVDTAKWVPKKPKGAIMPITAQAYDHAQIEGLITSVAEMKNGMTELREAVRGIVQSHQDSNTALSNTLNALTLNVLVLQNGPI